MSSAKRKRTKKVDLNEQFVQNENFRYTVKLIEEKRQAKNSSICWNYFGYIYRNDVLFDDNHYYCSICVPQTFSARYVKVNSTTPMLNHLSTRHDINVTPVEQALARVDSTSSSTSTNKKTVLARQIALWVSRDLRPFSTSSSVGFQQFAINTGIIKNINELPDERTIAGSALNDVYLVLEHALKEKLKSIDTVFTLMTDIWTDNVGNRPFINISIQFMTKDMKIEKALLTTQYMERPHTGTKIAEVIEKTLNYYEIHQKYYLVCDGAKNMDAAFNSLVNCIRRLNCEAHIINSILSADLEKSQAYKNTCSEVMKKIKKIHGSIVYRLHELKSIFEAEQTKDIISYINEWENYLQDQILSDEEVGIDNDEILKNIFNDTTKEMPAFNAFKKENATRWNSKLSMIKSFMSNINAINMCLAKLNHTDLCLTADEIENIIPVQELLNTFESSLKVLQTSAEPTTNLILLFRNAIKNKISDYIEKEKPNSALWSDILSSTEKRFTPHKEYLLASILDHAQCRSNFVAKTCEDYGCTPLDIINEFLELYDFQRSVSNDSVEINESQTQNITQELSPVMNAKLSLLMEIEGTEEEIIVNSIEDEFNKYLALSLKTPRSADVLTFWINNQNELPNLTKLARIVLSLSPTSSECERSFSLAGVLLNKQRASMNPTKARKAILINANYNLVSSIFETKK
ncbi:hypothetical protein PVAND_003394 [Polypedilum vanderplanki]|uniref:HAT C-terminal dimerisation domain-containing protein n=1 Tax=Polypedilum vanderplanki TaxID=319348 RepID=A0A9J6BTW7_POLVA|nr:hypothetical protein PVAND_003394 [Polypedilum vanderplanki]